MWAGRHVRFVAAKIFINLHLEIHVIVVWLMVMRACLSQNDVLFESAITIDSAYIYCILPID